MRALHVGLRCERLFQPHLSEDARRYALADIPGESPAIAVAAFRGAALSDNPHERRDAAASLPYLALPFPEEAEQLCRRLLDDADEAVTNAAQIAAEFIWGRWRLNPRAG